MTFTKEQLQEIIDTDHVQCGDASALARMALAGMEAEPVFKINHDSSLIKHVKKVVRETSAPQPLTTSERAELENYRNAQQVVPDDAQSRELFEKWCSVNIERNKWHPEHYAHLPAREQWSAWSACRVAMLQGKSEPVSNRDELPSREHFISLCNQFWNWQEADEINAGEEEPRLEWNGTAFSHRVTQALWRMYQASPGNSPVIPDGWVACSERMPDVGDVVLTAKDGFVNVGEMERSGANYRYFTSIASGRELPATHWQPLPAAPQQEDE